MIDVVIQIAAIDLARSAIACRYILGIQAAFVYDGSSAFGSDGAVCLSEFVKGCTNDNIVVTIAIEVAHQADRKSKVSVGIGRFNDVAANVVGDVVQVNGVFKGIDAECGGSSCKAGIASSICIASYWHCDASGYE